MTSQPLEKFIADIREQIQVGELETALDLLQSFLGAGAQPLQNEAILYLSRYNLLRQDQRQGLITRETARVEQTQLEKNILDFLDKLPKSVTKAMSPSPTVVEISTTFKESLDTSFQKIIGINNLKQISWIQQATIASRSVCRILTPKGFGTGFLISNDRIMTNNHVIPTPEIAGKSYAEFNYEQKNDGSYLPTFRFKLCPNLFHTSQELDYTIVGLVAEPDHPPFSEWGSLSLNPHANPIPNEHVIIIQHPNGGLKQIAMTANQVVKTKNQYLLYTTDTMPGSSGSPVFNDLWQVIAIHHAYGGITQVDRKNYYVNEGVLMSSIKVHANEYWPA